LVFRELVGFGEIRRTEIRTFWEDENVGADIGGQQVATNPPNLWEVILPPALEEDVPVGGF
jgi:hypothetical protein